MAILSRTAGWIPAISERSQNFGYNALARFSQIIQKNMLSVTLIEHSQSYLVFNNFLETLA